MMCFLKCVYIKTIKFRCCYPITTNWFTATCNINGGQNWNKPNL